MRRRRASSPALERLLPDIGILDDERAWAALRRTGLIAGRQPNVSRRGARSDVGELEQRRDEANQRDADDEVAQTCHKMIAAHSAAFTPQ